MMAIKVSFFGTLIKKVICCFIKQPFIPTLILF